MILSFADKETEKVFHQEFSTKLPVDIQRRAFEKLVRLDNTVSLNDLRCPPSNHLEKLSGDPNGRWSIRINNQWRICFLPTDGGSDYIEVEIVDYH